jgi:hypothetical protein
MVCFSSTSFSHRRSMDRFCGYHHLGCADCAVGSWSEHASLIERDHFLLVCLGRCHDCNCYSGACCYPSDCRPTVVEGCNGFVLIVCVGIHFRHLCVFIVLPANPFVMELIMMARPAVAFLAPEGWKEYA